MQHSLNNRQKILKAYYRRAYYTRHRDFLLAKQREYYRSNREAMLAQKKIRGKMYPQKLLAQRRRYYKIHRDAIIQNRLGYYYKNRRRILAQKKLRFKIHRHEILARNRAYRKKCYEKNPQEFLAQQRAYQKKYSYNNREKLLARKRAYYKRNRDAIAQKRKEYWREYYQKNRQSISLRSKTYYKKNRNDFRLRNRKYYYTNRKKILAQQKARSQKISPEKNTNTFASKRFLSPLLSNIPPANLKNFSLKLLFPNKLSNPKSKFPIPMPNKIQSSNFQCVEPKPRFDSEAENIQDEIFRKMPVSKKLRLVSDFSVFLMELNKLNSK